MHKRCWKASCMISCHMLAGLQFQQRILQGDQHSGASDTRSRRVRVQPVSTGLCLQAMRTSA